MHVWLRILLLMISIIVSSGLIVIYSPVVIDLVKAYNYHPSSRIQTATTRLALTDRSTQILYATTPAVQDQTQLNTSCQSEERTAAILGCYYRDRTYLFDVQNKELDGALEITTAHEMLHAAYQRLNVFERSYIDAMITAEYAKIKDRADIKEIMAYYTKAEPGAEINELHSIIGTTIASLDPELEQYYTRYFKDRASVVALNTRYTKVFDDANKRANELQASLKIQEPQIAADLAEYNTARSQLEIDITSFNQRAASGGFSSQSSFIVARNALVARVDALNTRQEQINAKVDMYNAAVAELNALSVRLGELSKSINGAVATPGL